MEVGTWYHKYNTLKYRILVELRKAKKNGEGGITSQVIADRLGVDRHRISDIMGRWHHKKYRYIRRLNKKDGKFYRYIITAYGEETVRKYSNRIQNEYDLNLRRKPRQSQSYIGVTQKGKDLGLSTKDVWDEMSAIIKKKSKVED
jgi:hypothetical protein